MSNLAVIMRVCEQFKRSEREGGRERKRGRESYKRCIMEGVWEEAIRALGQATKAALAM